MAFGVEITQQPKHFRADLTPEHATSKGAVRAEPTFADWFPRGILNVSGICKLLNLTAARDGIEPPTPPCQAAYRIKEVV
jgi:hypothetical protein